MKLEDQVCSLELAKRLKELGVKQTSLWIWFRNKQSNEEIRLVYIANDEKPVWYRTDGKEGIALVEYYSAFTIAELGEILLFKDIKIECYKLNNNHEYYEESTPIYIEILHLGFYAESEANARAKILIYLMENKLIEMPK